MAISRHLLAAARMLVVVTILLGLAYPLAITGIARLAPGRADGSLVTDGGAVVGSRLLGQPPSGAEWFQGRPSASDAAGEVSGGSNLAASNPEQQTALVDRATELRAENPLALGGLPPDAVTASGSGLDPDISPDYAIWQVPRVAAERGLDPGRLRSLVEEHTSTPALGFVGTSRVNVLELNAALTRLSAG